ncbi:MAG: ABC transporter ATP-binding protein [Burkholderiaceae bacterium]
MRLTLEDISHHYGALEVLRDVAFTIDPGRIVCLIGPSGCGKSTLLRFLGGLERPDRGRVMIAGEPPADTLNALTYVFQDFALLPWRTVRGNIELVLEPHRLSRAARDARIAEVLARTGLTGFESAFPRQLSGGMRQRVAIARALSVRPAVLLMDEPLSALDSQTRELLLDDLISLWSREPFAACYVTHNLHEAVRIGHRVIVLSRRPGQVREIIDIDIPLQERQHAADALAQIHDRLWRLLRDDAVAAERELAGGA